MTHDIIGQASALAAVGRFLDDVPSGTAGLVVEGAVGTGKSALWTATVADARARGFTVLASRPVEAEASMAFAVLGDLLHGVLEDVMPTLPGPQARALRVATLLEDPGDPAPDHRAVSVATHTVLRSLAARSPVLVAIDDSRWVDGASSRVIEFVLRRLDDEPVGIVVVARPEERVSIPWLADASAGQSHRHTVTPAALGTDDLGALIRTRLSESFPTSVLREIQEASGGNPLFALEIARSLLSGEIRRDVGTRLSIPRSLQQFVGNRIGNLPRDVRTTLFLAAAVPDATIDLLARANPPLERVRAAGAFAERAGLVEVDGDRIRFTHPLFASTLYHAVPANERRELHRILAGVARDIDEQARHLALSATGPDRAVAAVLDEAARRAGARGAPDAAAVLAEEASRLTPSAEPQALAQRQVDAAEYHFAAGETDRARLLLEALAAGVEAGPVRASILQRLAKVRYRTDSSAVAAELLTRALDEAGDDGSLRAGIERDLAWAVVLCGDVPDAAVHAREALRLAESTGDAGSVAEPLASVTMVGFLLGHGFDDEQIERAVALERARPGVPIEWRPSMIHGMLLKWSGDLDRARRQFDVLSDAARDAGEEVSLPFLLGQMSETATWAGDWDAARKHATDGHAIALQTGQEPIRASVLYATALIDAHLGMIEEARVAAHEGLRLSEAAGAVVWMMQNQAVLGFVELSMDDHVAAHAWLAPLVAWHEVVGIREPGFLRFIPDEVEALIGLGEIEQADRLLTGYEADAARLGRSSAMLPAARCRALLVAATGDQHAAAASLEQALAAYGSVPQPFERARALLTLGAIQRRTLSRKAARESLQSAQREFTELGAKVWSEKASMLLGSPRASRSAGSAAPVLTPSEQRVAEAVAAGATNREVADRLFVSVRAVEVHLTSVYRKLGLNSRTQLAVRMATTGSTPADEARSANGVASDLATGREVRPGG